MVQLGVARTLRTTRSGHEWPMGNILFLSSSPNAAPDGGYAVPEPAVLRVREASDFGPLEVGLEVAEVRGELAGVPGAFRLAHLPNASIVDMIRALAGGRYEVVHFSGHASDRGLVLAGDGNPRYLSSVDLGTLVSLGGRVRLLVLNACCSQTLVGEVAKIADFVITMNERIYDQEARAFSRVLYLLLARGKSLAEAFDGATLAAQGSGKPCLAACTDASANEAFFARRASRQSEGLSGWGDCDVWVLDRAGAEERQLIELLRDSMGVNLGQATRHLNEGSARVAMMMEDVASKRLRELRGLGALVTMARRWVGDDVELIRDSNGLWFGSLPSWASPERAWLGLHPVTRGQFSALNGRRSTRAEERLPQATLSLAEVLALCETLTLSGNGYRYRLPTREEWLAAAHDQVELAAADADALRRLGWFDATSATDVGHHLPNERGFLDLPGNVAEWTSTRLGDQQVVCGGSFRSSASKLAADWTELAPPDLRAPWLGFRLLRVGGPS